MITVITIILTLVFLSKTDFIIDRNALSISNIVHHPPYFFITQVINKTQGGMHVEFD